MLQLRDPQKAPVASAEEDFCTGGVLKTRFWQETGKYGSFINKKKADTELNPKSKFKPKSIICDHEANVHISQRGQRQTIQNRR